MRTVHMGPPHLRSNFAWRSGRRLRRTLSNVSGRRVDAFTATAACVALAEVACVHPPLRVGHATKVMLEKWNPRGTPLLSPTAQFSLAR